MSAAKRCFILHENRRSITAPKAEVQELGEGGDHQAAAERCAQIQVENGALAGAQGNLSRHFDSYCVIPVLVAHVVKDLCRLPTISERSLGGAVSGQDIERIPD